MLKYVWNALDFVLGLAAKLTFTEWMWVLVAVVAFGFLCMRGMAAKLYA
jgi:hypothetical protein